MGRLAALCPGDRLHVFGPLPPWFERGKAHDTVTDVDDPDLTLVSKRSSLIRVVEPLALQTRHDQPSFSCPDFRDVIYLNRPSRSTESGRSRARLEGWPQTGRPDRRGCAEASGSDAGSARHRAERVAGSGGTLACSKDVRQRPSVIVPTVWCVWTRG